MTTNTREAFEEHLRQMRARESRKTQNHSDEHLQATLREYASKRPGAKQKQQEVVEENVVQKKTEKAGRKHNGQFAKKSDS